MTSRSLQKMMAGMSGAAARTGDYKKKEIVKSCTVRTIEWQENQINQYHMKITIKLQKNSVRMHENKYTSLKILQYIGLKLIIF